MLIGFDLDSVLAQFIPPLVEYYNHHYHAHLRSEDYMHHDLTKVWNCTPKEVIERVFDFYRSPYMDKMKPVSGAIEAVDYLGKKYQMVVITSRPHFTDKITSLWVERYFPKKFKAIHHTNQFSHEHETRVKKSKVCRDLGVEVFFEDHLDFALDCASENIKVFLLPMPWNMKAGKLAKNITRISSWKEIRKYL